MIRPALPGDAPAITALLNHWIAHSAITFTPTPKTAAEVADSIAAVSYTHLTLPTSDLV